MPLADAIAADLLVWTIVAHRRIPVTGVIALIVVLALAAAAAGYAGTREIRRSAGQAAAAPTGPRPSSSVAAGPSAATSAAAPDAAVAAASAAVAAAGKAPSALPLPAAGAPAVASRLAAATRTALASTAFGPTLHGLVVDARTGSNLLSRGSTATSAPASTAKLTTMTAALAVVGGQARMTTRIVAGTTPGQVVLIGGGDPTLSAARAGSPTLYRGAARLSTLAAEARAASKRPVTSIVIDTSLYSGSSLGPGWDPDDVPTNYASAIQSLVVDGGLPATGGDIRSAQPALEAGKALARLLGHPSLPISVGRARAGAAVLGSVRSATVLDLAEEALMTSDNVIAEMLGRQVARVEHEPLSFAGTAAGVRRALASLGFRLPATLVDGSGLSRRDRLSPAVLVALLRLDSSAAHPVLNQIVSALPVAGWDGSLRPRYQLGPSSAAAGRVRAKTGTLSGVVALAGLVRDRSGRLLIFAFLASKVPVGGTFGAEAALDNLVAAFAGCGCG